MARKIILIITAVTVLAAWPLSFIKTPPGFAMATVFHKDNAGEERQLLLQKLGLAVSPVKRLYYNKITTIPARMYTANLLNLVNPNYYFFANRPQVDVNDKDMRMKFPYPAVFPFAAGIYLAVKKNRHRKLWLYAGAVVLVAALFRQSDGWNFTLYPAIGLFTTDGIKEIGKSRLGPLWLLLITVISLTEIARLFI
jgi:hypothetical protein